MIPSRWPDATALVLDYLRPHFPHITITRTRNATDARQVVVGDVYGGRTTAITRSCTILLSAWVIDPDGHGNLHEARELMGDVMYRLQLMTRLPEVVTATEGSGPTAVKDTTEVEYAEGSVVLGIHRNR
ncbi:hypothetical protein GCM10022198_00200 [Klugiella xanthotipulae]|uniref:DUF3168 domain-containing protein n=1 Tax=Klugiella xanthotipulae TaxID=244735 RepID=A0A543I5I3_9MICO|nr:hypothetical protein [Klugiella xanthotipulae]TQM65839.1 hypothetical protein FB466_0653 [Klugiella xanthotipulae]